MPPRATANLPLISNQRAARKRQSLPEWQARSGAFAAVSLDSRKVLTRSEFSALPKTANGFRERPAMRGKRANSGTLLGVIFDVA